MSRIELPAAPQDQTGAVKCWSEPVTIKTYPPMPADKNPMFLDKRVYQGSSGKVYPLPFIDRISETPINQSWQAIHLENAYVRLMILPELGGRIHIGLDKTTGYDFFYRQNVIKPALVGLAGPWISGGVEFNWPQHHRPSTFMPAEVEIEKNEDGSATVWCSEHEPMNSMKGMHGICLHPDQSLIELKVRLYNRTELTQTFLWWANVAARVHERYQSFFPRDVRYVADHAKRAMSTFPKAQGHYYGVDYQSRAMHGVDDDERPAQFLPDAVQISANDLSWYANIPVPTSYMAMGTRQEFFGGYDHAADAGFVHVANPHISPGKKQWTWGNHEFGYAWDRNLTESDGPYIELMAGVYTDNQPDFSFLHPGETRTWSQYWYPISQIGVPVIANRHAAISMSDEGDGVRIGVGVTQAVRGARLEVFSNDTLMHRTTIDVAPNTPWTGAFGNVELTNAKVRLTGIAGGSLEASMAIAGSDEVPPPASEPALPVEVKGVEELYLIGLHLEQYRHATRLPELYWREGLAREPGDARCNHAMGLWHYRRGEYEAARKHFSTAIATLTRLNPNPRDGEVFYSAGLALRRLHQRDEAYGAFYKATWNYAWQSPAFFQLAQMDCERGNWESALAHIERALSVNAQHLQAMHLQAIVLRRLHRDAQALQVLNRCIELDKLDYAARLLLDTEAQCEAQTRLDVSLEFTAAGQFELALAVVQRMDPGVLPAYYRAFFLDRLGRASESEQALAQAQTPSPDYCFPARLEEIDILRFAIDRSADDGIARYALGNLYYDRRRHEEAIALWQEAAGLLADYSVVWRNLGIAEFNIRKNSEAAAQAYQRARQADPKDARLLYEQDQLWKLMATPPVQRLANLVNSPDLIAQRDDLSVELATLQNQLGQPEEALRILKQRSFQPWEGGEGRTLAQFVRACLLVGRAKLKAGNAAQAVAAFNDALKPPATLGEAKHLLANQSDIHFWLGLAFDESGITEQAQRHWKIASRARGDFQQMSVRQFSEMTFYSALALRRLGQDHAAQKLLLDLQDYAQELNRQTARIDFFATSLPTMLLFEADIQQEQDARAKLLLAQARFGLGEAEGAKQLCQELLIANPNNELAADFKAMIEHFDQALTFH